jgi:hypothetical protein
VMNRFACRAVERLGHPPQRRQGLGGRWRAKLAQHRIQRFAGDVFLGQVRCDALDTGGKRGRHARMLGLVGGEVLEFDRQLGGLFRGDVEPERLDGDQASAHRVVRAEDRSETAGPNLMQHAKGTKRSGRGVVQGTVRAQRWYSSSSRDVAVKGS